MKYKIRKCQEATIWMASEVAELDCEIFKNLKENPYTGNSEEEFLKYISEFMENFDYYCPPEDLDDAEVLEQLSKISSDEAELKEYYNSAMDYANCWFESGEENNSFRKTGGFEVNFRSND